jgi:hypothetical protein
MKLTKAVMLYTVLFAYLLYATTSVMPSGTGDSANPYQIDSLPNLLWLSQNSSAWSGYFVQNADIDASPTSTWNNDSGFSPIGNSNAPFNGKYNGRGHKISGLYIYRWFYDSLGVFGNFSGFVDSVVVTDCNITGRYYLGGLVGANYGGTITNCQALNCKFDGHESTVGSLAGCIKLGTITNCYALCKDSGYSSVGGLVGEIDSSTMSDCFTKGRVSGNSYVGGIVGNIRNSIVSDCYSIAEIYCSGSIAGGLCGMDYQSTITDCYFTGNILKGSTAGGLIGDNYSGTVSNCYSTGNIQNSDGAGGFVGYNTFSGTIYNCYATGNVQNCSGAGGFAGCNTQDGTIYNCYATGEVSGKTYVGGFAGANMNSSNIYCCYAAGIVSGLEKKYTGGFVGHNDSSIINNCYWDVDASGQTAGYESGDGTFFSFSGFTTDKMKKSSNFTGFNFNTVWTIREDSTYPALKSLENNAPFAFADSYTVTTGTYAVSDFLKNDLDIETLQENLVLKVSYASAGVETDGISSVTFSGGLVDTIKYRIGEVRADKSDTLWGNTAAVVYKIPSPPVLVSPADNAADISTVLRFLWSKLNGADSYSIQIAEDSLFEFTIDTTVSDTTLVIKNLSNSRKYYWRVKASCDLITSEWSSPGCFTTIAQGASTFSRMFGAGSSGFSVCQSGIIRYELPVMTHVSISLYKLDGKLVYCPVNSIQEAGNHLLYLDKSIMSQGSYVAVFRISGNELIRTVNLTR